MAMTLSAPAVQGALWHQAPVFILVLDGEERVIEANPFAIAVAGESIRGRRLAELVVQFAGPLDLAAWRENPDRMQRIHLQLPDGQLQSLMVRLFDIDDNTLLMGWPDVIELMRLQERFIGLNAELNNLNREVLKKNAALDRLNGLKDLFLGMAAHDLRRPAGLIQNGCELLLEECGHFFDDDQRELFEMVIDTSRSMVRLINDFLDVAVIESGRLQLTLSVATPAELVDRSLQNCGHLAGQAGVELVCGPPENWMHTTKLTVDADKLGQALDNLIGNAVEHSKTGDRVVVESTLTETAVAFAVIDTGPGIPAAEITGLFQPFGRSGVAKLRGRRSVGLGLSIAHAIVKAHRGSLTVDSRVGVGSVFRIEIPLKTIPTTP